jgi:hypothetical protein
MDNPGKKITEIIKSKKIAPESRFHLRWKSYLFWSGLFAMAVLGALFFSLIILNFLDISPDFFHYVGLGKILRALILTTPFLWIILLLVALILSLLMFRKTARGYRHSLLLATVIGVLFVSVAGTLFHFSKFNRQFGDGISRSMSPFSRRMAFPIEKRWQNPESGFLAGRVAEISSDSSFLIISLNEENWLVIHTPKTKIMFPDPISVDMQLAVVGEKIEDEKFEADYINLAPEFPSHRFGKGMRKGEGEGPRMFMRNRQNSN